MQPVLHDGVWWFRHPDGSWSRWDAGLEQWVPFQAPAARTRPFEHLGGIAKWTIGAVLFDLAMSAVAAAIALRLLASIEPTEQIDFEEFARSGYQAALQLPGVVTYLSGILFAVWFYRAYQNVLALRATGRYSPGWAIGAWFVPILNLFRPKQIADDIWRTSDPALSTEPGSSWMELKVDPLLHWWWAAWVLTSVVGIVLFPIAFFGQPNASDIFSESGANGPSFAPFIRAFSMTIVASSASRIVAGLLAIRVVKVLTERQAERAAQLGLSESARF